MVKPTLLLVLMTSGAATCVAGPASAASFLAAAPLQPAIAGQLSCLVSRADASLVAWQERMRTIRAGALSDPAHVATIGSSDRCPAAASPPDGSPALATQADVGGDNGLQLAARPPRGVRVGVAPSRRLGRPQAVRVRVTCPRRCSVRVAADLISGKFDSSRLLQPGTTLLRVPYFSGSASARSRPLRAARRVQLGIAVDDATGELRAQRTVVVRP